MDHGANVNARGDDDEFPLYLAAGCEDPELMLTLLYRGADIDLKDSLEGETALHQLVLDDESALEMVKILLSVDADIFAEANDGSSFFSFMCGVSDSDDPSKKQMLKTLALRKNDIQPSAEQKVKEMMKKYPEVRKFYEDCIEELGRLKNARFIKNCSFYDVLTKCQCEMTTFMRNFDFKSNFELTDLNVFAPIYAEDILKAYDRAENFFRLVLKQEDLIDEASEYIFPHMIVRKVTKYSLNCRICELKMIVNASRSNKICK